MSTIYKRINVVMQAYKPKETQGIKRLRLTFRNPKREYPYSPDNLMFCSSKRNNPVIKKDIAPKGKNTTIKKKEEPLLINGPIVVIDVGLKMFLKFNSIEDASSQLGLDLQTIQKNLSGKMIYKEDCYWLTYEEFQTIKDKYSDFKNQSKKTFLEIKAISKFRRMTHQKQQELIKEAEEKGGNYINLLIESIKKEELQTYIDKISSLYKVLINSEELEASAANKEDNTNPEEDRERIESVKKLYDNIINYIETGEKALEDMPQLDANAKKTVQVTCAEKRVSPGVAMLLKRIGFSSSLVCDMIINFNHLNTYKINGMHYSTYIPEYCSKLDSEVAYFLTYNDIGLSSLTKQTRRKVYVERRYTLEIEELRKPLKYCIALINKGIPPMESSSVSSYIRQLITREKKMESPVHVMEKSKPANLESNV